MDADEREPVRTTADTEPTDTEPTDTEPNDTEPTNVVTAASEPVRESSDDVRDELPEDLVAVGHLGAYRFPDNSRRRIPGVTYVVIAAFAALAYVTLADDSAVVNAGFGWAALGLGAFGLWSIASGWRMRVDEKQALVEAQQAVGFAVGHASAQQVWHGFRSRPTWRVLCYSTEEPPRQRGLVLVDAVDGRVIEHLVESNPEAWTAE